MRQHIRCVFANILILDDLPFWRDELLPLLGHKPVADIVPLLTLLRLLDLDLSPQKAFRCDVVGIEVNTLHPCGAVAPMDGASNRRTGFDLAAVPTYVSA